MKKVLTEAEMAKRKKFNKRMLIIIGSILFVFWLIGHFATDTKPSVNTTTDTSKINIDSTNHAVNTDSDNWTYSEDNSDKMENTVIKYAECTATDKLDFKFPYNGGSSLTITLRHGFHKKGNEVYITVNKGQFVSGDIDNNVVRVKFDEAKPVSFEYSEPSSGTVGLIFIDDPALFIQKLKKSKHVVFEANYYDEGMMQSEFNTANLKWQ